MTALTLALLLMAGTASAQTFAPGSATFPSPPMGRHFLDQPIAQCVVATPVPGNPNAVLLTPCAVPPVSVTPPMVTPPVAEPKAAEAPREPTVIRIEVVPVAPAPPAPKVAPKAQPKKKECPC